MEKVKLIDVAKKAGVSKSTASQYINGRYEYMSEKTREKLRLAIEELDFIPNPIARNLKAGKTNTIGIVVKSISGVVTSQIIRSMDDYFKKLNYSVIIYNTDYIKEQELKSISILKSMRVDGLIITSSGEISKELNAEEANGLPIVHILREFNDLSVNTVLSDYLKGSEMAGDYLASLGHSNIAIITKPYNNSPSRVNRVNGCINALNKANISVDESHIGFLDDNSKIGEVFDQLNNQNPSPTVIFSMFSDITIALLHHFKTNNISIPEDIQVITFDDFTLAELLRTPLTAIHQNPIELGKASAKLLVEKINNPTKSFESITLPCDLIIRESTKKI